MTKTFRIAIVLLLFAAGMSAQSNDAAYIKTLTLRSTKIVKKLNISDTAVFNRVVNILVNEYASVGKIFDDNNAAMKAAKATAGNNKASLQALDKTIEGDTNTQLYNLYCAFTGALSGDLTPQQIEEVKNAMTYNVLKVTYGAYLAMIPTLKPNEKRQIYSWLVEAREHAIEAPSSGKKHAWFNKYKGRINNYLSKQGYNMQQERVAWAKRIKEAQAKK
ncbi:DUF3826 domain-containing protein [Microbacter margulisiae]|uniref:DUF3826 domain-containing protein n=1 Tax=Microbacter margulisiae TaxID=1350067 RepID=A0A7W5DRP7_9PORP|nr:DUF3826 domain-containing protein [Microbacter margulisiae]MBB3186988.1 hypothetical protein [Microbacter margulisiae]